MSHAHRTASVGSSVRDAARPVVRDVSGTWSIAVEHVPAELSPAGVRSFEKMAEWRDIKVPSAWQTVLGEDVLAHKEAGWSGGVGVAWYRRTLEIDDALRGSSRVSIRFAAVATIATVFIDGVRVGEHSGDWLPFEFDVTEAVAGKQSVELLVRVDKVIAPPQVMVDGVPVQNGHLTKGFHDLLSCHHGGIWDRVELRGTGETSFIPGGVTAVTDGEGGRVAITCEFARAAADGLVRAVLKDRRGRVVGRSETWVRAGAASVEMTLRVEKPELWWPEAPALYGLDVEVEESGVVSDRESVRIGFRMVTISPERGGQMLLNGRPILLRGLLDWGHEKDTIAPARHKAEYVARFKKLKAMGFNVLCVCMWYPPKSYYDAADEVGLMLWQEHPIWKSDMRDERLSEYYPQFEGFFRRDRNHASVVLVSGSCEHERFNPTLGAWWWDRARTLLPDRALQVQTAFLAWTDLSKSDLYDEHTYDSAGRWVTYLRDLQREIAGFGVPKPFVMGEAVLYTSWPDVNALQQAAQNLRDVGRRGKWPWWFPRGFDAKIAFEHWLRERFGPQTLSRFREQGDRYNLLGRKFQFERFREYPNHAGLVMNHYNDVPQCRCGFVDDLDRWRFDAAQVRGWACDVACLLRTPGHLAGLEGGRTHRVDVVISNFGPGEVRGRVALNINGVPAGVAMSHARCGEVSDVGVWLTLPRVSRPTKMRVEAHPEAGSGIEPNAWELWALPPRAAVPGGVYAQETPAPEARFLAHDFEENKYSSGWGLRNRSWKLRRADPCALIPEAPRAAWSVAVPRPCRVMVATRWTDALVEWLQGGGRVLFLPVKGEGSIPTKYVNLWGQVPLVIETPERQGPIGAGESGWVCDLLDYDLNRFSMRAVLADELEIADLVQPIVRLVYTHDMQDRIKPFDQLFSARVGKGLLCVSTLDHGEPAGELMLDRVLAWLTRDDAGSDGEIPVEIVAGWVKTIVEATKPPAGFAMATE